MTEKFLEEGIRQMQAANGKAVEWVMSNEKAATAARKIFEENDLDIAVRVEKMTNWQSGVRLVRFRGNAWAAPGALSPDAAHVRVSGGTRISA
jgi:hypothetical protein